MKVGSNRGKHLSILGSSEQCCFLHIGPVTDIFQPKLFSPGPRFSFNFSSNIYNNMSSLVLQYKAFFKIYVSAP